MYKLASEFLYKEATLYNNVILFQSDHLNEYEPQNIINQIYFGT